MEVAPFGSGAFYRFFDTSGALFDLLKCRYKKEVFNAMQETIYVGLDLGSSRCQQTVIGADGSDGVSVQLRFFANKVETRVRRW